jgi:hypothetical protein
MRRAKWQPSPVPCMEFFIYFFGIYNAYFFLIITFNTAKLIIPSVITHKKQLVASERHYYMGNSYKRYTNTSCVMDHFVPFQNNTVSCMLQTNGMKKNSIARYFWQKYCKIPFLGVKLRNNVTTYFQANKNNLFLVMWVYLFFFYGPLSYFSYDEILFIVHAKPFLHELTAFLV